MFFRTLIASRHEVTWYSRLGAIIIFLGAIPLFCLYVGWELAILNQTTYPPSELMPESDGPPPKTALSPQLLALNEKLLAEGTCARNSEAPGSPTPKRDSYTEYEKRFLNEELGMSFKAFITKDLPVLVEVACDYNHIVITGAIEQVLEGPNLRVDTRTEEPPLPLVSSVFSDRGAVTLEADYNFDGYNDLKSVDYPFAHGEHAYFFLFDEKTKQFIKNDDLSELYSPYVGSGTIESSSFSGGGASIKKITYTWSSEGVLEKLYDLECNTEYHASTSIITIAVRHYRGNKLIGEIQHEENGECP